MQILEQRLQIDAAQGFGSNNQQAGPSSSALHKAVRPVAIMPLYPASLSIISANAPSRPIGASTMARSETGIGSSLALILEQRRAGAHVRGDTAQYALEMIERLADSHALAADAVLANG